MSQFTFQDANSKVINLEKKYYNLFKFQNINFWPLFRNILYSSFLTSEYLEQPRSTKYFILSFIKFYIREFCKFIIYNAQNYILKSENNKRNIFFSSKKSIYRANNLKYYDIVVDPIINKKKNYSKLYLDNFNFFRPYFFSVSSWGVLFPLKIKKNYIPNNIKILVIRICNDENLNSQKILNVFNDHLLNFWYYKKIGDRLFKKFRKIRKAFFDPWYSTSAMGLIYSAKINKIKTFDIQHGWQNKYNTIYNFWKKTPKKGYQILPDFFYCWNTKTISHHNITSNHYFKINHKSIFLNLNWYQFYKKNLFKKNNKYTKIQKKILFCLQPIQKNNENIVPNFFKYFLLSKASKNVQIIFRLHPNNKKYCKKKLNSFLKLGFNRDIKIDDADLNIYDALNKGVTHCLSKSSTTALDAWQMGVKSALYAQDLNLNYYKRFKRKMQIRKLTPKVSTLINWIK